MTLRGKGQAGKHRHRLDLNEKRDSKSGGATAASCKNQLLPLTPGKSNRRGEKGGGAIGERKRDLGGR